METCYLCREPVEDGAPWPRDRVVVNDQYSTVAHGGCLADEAYTEGRDRVDDRE